MRHKKISKVGARWNDLLKDSKEKMNDINEKADKKSDKKSKKKSVKDENNFDVGDIGVDIDESFDDDSETFESEV